MAVTKLKRRSEVSSNDDSGLQHTQVYLVCFDTFTEGTPEALVASLGDVSIPARGEAFRVDDGTFCSSSSAKKIEKSLHEFEVTCEFKQPAGGGFTYEVNPLLRPPDISYENNEATEPYFMDRSDTPKPVVNTAKDTFEEMPQRECGELAINYSRNEASFIPTTEHVVNSDAVTIDGITYAANLLKLSPPTAAKTTEPVGGIPFTYYKVSYQIKVRKDGWDDQPLSMGYSQLKDGKKVRIKDAGGREVVKPWPLTSAGLAASDPTAAPFKMSFKPYTNEAFSTYAFL